MGHRAANGDCVGRVRTTRWPTPTTEGRWRSRAALTGDALSEAWAAFLGRVPWTHFWTLTFDPKRRFPVPERLASREAFAWANQGSRVRRSPLGWMYATERGASGLWHVHALTAATSTEVADYMESDWRLRNGHVHVRPVTNSVKSVLYSTKSAAERGEVVCADTLGDFRDVLVDVELVSLYGAEA